MWPSAERGLSGLPFGLGHGKCGAGSHSEEDLGREDMWDGIAKLMRLWDARVDSQVEDRDIPWSNQLLVPDTEHQ